jgi:hypothetical protein
MTQNNTGSTPQTGGRLPAPGDEGQAPAVMPAVPTPHSTPEEITALDALHFGWNRHIMRRVDQGLSVLGGFVYEPSAIERAAVRAWVTATDERIGHAVYVGDRDPEGFAFVAREVTALDDDALLGRYQERRRVLDTGRYQVRGALQVPRDERARLSGQFGAAADRFETDAETGVQYARASRGLFEGWGYVVWDRVNHRYVAALWRSDAEEIAAECERMNQRHAEHFSRSGLWS